MNPFESLRRQFAYDEWANREVLAAMRAQRSDEEALRYMSHILAAERLWLERLRQQPQSVAVWPEADLGHAEAEAVKLGRQWRDYLDAAADLTGMISYKNSKGEVWSSAIQDILTHVVMHSAYHRGQIASHMRALGLTPAYTDFIHCVRQGMVK